MIDQFNPASAQRLLKEHEKALEVLGAELKDKRNEYTLALAELQDNEQEARDDIFKDNILVKATQTRDWIKWRTHEKQKAHDKAQNELRGIQERLNLRYELLNSLKKRIELWRIEAQNLNNY